MADIRVNTPRQSARQGPGGTGTPVDSLVASLALLAVAGIAAVMFLLALGFADPAQIMPDTQLRARLLGWLDGPLWVKLVTAGGSLLVGLVSLWALLRRFGSRPAPSPRVHVLSADEQGVILVAREGISEVAETAALGAPGIVDVDVQIRNRGSEAVGLRIRAGVVPGADLQRAGAQVRDRARDAVEKLVGLSVRDVTVELDVLDAEDLGRRVE